MLRLLGRHTPLARAAGLRAGSLGNSARCYSVSIGIGVRYKTKVADLNPEELAKYQALRLQPTNLSKHSDEPPFLTWDGAEDQASSTVKQSKTNKNNNQKKSSNVDKTKPKHKKLLVLDIDETLISSDESCGTPHRDKSKPWDMVIQPYGIKSMFRPFAREFIAKFDPMFDIVIFTAAVHGYGVNAMEQLYPAKKFPLLSREKVYNGGAKDLSRLGRDLDQIVFIDNRSYAFQLQRRNAIYISDFDGQEDCTTFKDMFPLFEEIAKADNVYDVLDVYNASCEVVYRDSKSK